MSGLIGLDWGTSSLRAYWLDTAGEIRETRTRPWGIRHLPEGGFDAALADITAGWPQLPRLACGMVGSRQGWMEVPYMDLPADTAQLGSAVRSLRAHDGSDVHIVPGLRNPHSPDVIRGEETQLLGALALRPALIPDSSWIMPGTHSKWARVRDGAVTDFCTLMTGELFALLRQHSILCAGVGDAAASPDAFSRGVIAARDSGSAGGFSRLFSARALMLDGALAPDAVPEYLSGLLIGEELRSGLASNRFRHDAPLQLIGDAALCARYRLAAVHFDIDLVESLPDAAAHGLWQIACDIGLIGAGSSTAAKETSPC
ncbi:MAG: 2-dehydro-3-deoxygalactonokinase [Rhodanobacter sp.]|jgi:2-dehydro-3-deoxygalactonokinase|nr:2-dehydro-3-deoxygalactonokinase [Rhodanobacter sp.]ODT96724.1 MAG: 2-keto-3-deoxy-galactonokinase [Rhodanobacter sp. SCN 67-45]OJW41839.1 MAG: 2-keto-3-deoxy-galactonokinase [Rhodanobacter sp. 67-28]